MSSCPSCPRSHCSTTRHAYTTTGTRTRLALWKLVGSFQKLCASSSLHSISRTLFSTCPASLRSHCAMFILWNSQLCPSSSSPTIPKLPTLNSISRTCSLICPASPRSHFCSTRHASNTTTTRSRIFPWNWNLCAS
ncbi:unnamed protein product [Prunus brigantina]